MLVDEDEDDEFCGGSLDDLVIMKFMGPRKIYLRMWLKMKIVKTSKKYKSLQFSNFQHQR